MSTQTIVRFFLLAACAAAPVHAQVRAERVERALDKHRAEVAELEAVIRDVRHEVEAAREAGKRDHVRALEDKLSELHTSIDRHVAEIHELEVVLERAEDLHTRAPEQDVSPEQVEKSLHAAIKALKKAGQAEHAKVVAHVLERVQQRHAGPARDRDGPRDERVAEKSRAALEAHRARLHADEARLEAAHAELEAKRHALEAKRHELDRFREGRRVDEPVQRVERLERHIEEMQRAHREQLHRLEARIEELSGMVRRLAEHARREGERRDR